MKRKVIVTGMLAFALIALIAPQKAQAQYDFLNQANWDSVFDNMSKKYTDVTKEIKIDTTYKCENIRVIAQRPSNNPANNDPEKFGGIIQKNGKRRYPNTKLGPERIGGNGDTGIVAFEVPSGQPLAFIVFRDVEWYRPNANLRLFLFSGHIDIHTDKGGSVTGFTLVRGGIWEDKNFKANAAYDEVMTMYACVQDDPGWIQMDIPKILKDNNNNPDKAADVVITRWTALSGGLGALGGAAPLWALPAEFAQNFVENLNKARLAWAISQCYGRQRDFDDFKNDLYILFAGDDVGATLKDIAKATGSAALKDVPEELITNEKVLAAFAEKLGGNAASKKAVTEAVTKAVKTSGTAAKVESQAVKQAKGAGKAIFFVTVAIKGSMSANEAQKFGKNAKQFYRNPPAPKGVTFQNNTGTTVQIIQRKSGSVWYTVSTGSLKNGGKIEGVALGDGKYDLRLSTGEAFPKTVAFEKKNVDVKDGTIVTFSEKDKYKISRAEYQEFIQRRCNFSNANDVWKAMNTHPKADELYKTWAESYPKDGYFPYPKPSGKTDQVIIAEQCKFSKTDEQAVWTAVAKHSNAKSLLQKWADSYYRK